MEKAKEVRIVNAILGTDYSDKAIATFWGEQPEEIAAIRAETYDKLVIKAGL